MKKFIIIIAAAIIFVSCSNNFEEMSLAPTDTQDKNVEADPFSNTEEDAIALAEFYFEQLDNANNTRGKINRKPSSIIYISKDKQVTRSTPDDKTLLYLINYSDDQGFAVVCGHKNGTQLYAISDEGNLLPQDTLFNKGLALFFNQAEEEARSSMPAEWTAGFDTLPRPDTGFVPYPNDPVRTVTVNSPMLSYQASRWGQGYPFNLLTPTINGQHTLVGCGAVACAMIMSYHGWPESYGNQTLDWDDINTLTPTQNFQLQYLLQQLGKRANLSINYSLTGSVCSESSFARTFVNFGYNNASFQSFYDSNVNAYLSATSYSKSPVLVVGRDQVDEQAGHAWVMDGSIVTTTLIGMATPDQGVTVITDYLFHCVWGWYGSSNGYFHWSSSNGITGSPEQLDQHDNPDASNVPWTFVNLKYRGNFIKQI